MHTVILGNGILALTIAFRLAQRLEPSDRVTMVAKQSRPGSATLAAAAMLNSFAEIEAGSLCSEIDLYRFELSHLATRMWPKFEKELIKAAGSSLPANCASCEGCSGGGCFDSGTYVVNNTSADYLDDENFDAIVAALKEFDEPFQTISPREIPSYSPAEKHRAIRAVYLPNEGWFNPRIIVEKLDAILRQYPQITFLDACAERLIQTGNIVSACTLEDGRMIEGDKFILATGATVTDILDKSNLKIQIQRVFYGIGVSIEIKNADSPQKKCIRTPNRGLACGLYSVPYFQSPDVPHDHILIGATNLISPTPLYNARAVNVESLLRGAMEQINVNLYRADLIRINVGWRPTTLDTYPILGKTSLKNLLIASGTKRDGFHLAPVISEKIVKLLFDEPVEEQFALFNPERKLIRQLSREEAITKAVRHQMSAAYQHGFTPSVSRMSEQLIKVYRDDLERLHDQVGAIDWGIPPEMLDMYRYGHAKT